MNNPYRRRFSRAFGSRSDITILYFLDCIETAIITLKVNVPSRTVCIQSMNALMHAPDHEYRGPNNVGVSTGLAIHRMMERNTDQSRSKNADLLSIAHAHTLAHLDAIEMAEVFEKCLVRGSSAERMYRKAGGYLFERQWRESHDLGIKTLKVKELSHSQFYALNEIWESIEDLKAYYRQHHPLIEVLIEQCSAEQKEKILIAGHPYIKEGAHAPE